MRIIYIRNAEIKVATFTRVPRSTGHVIYTLEPRRRQGSNHPGLGFPPPTSLSQGDSYPLLLVPSSVARAMAGNNSAGSGAGHASAGRGLRWQPVSPGSASSASSSARPVVSGLGLSPASDRPSSPASSAEEQRAAAEVAPSRGRIQDRLVWL
jgi:hypothetical protein